MVQKKLQKKVQKKKLWKKVQKKKLQLLQVELWWTQLQC
jgi:hypothetical protein